MKRSKNNSNAVFKNYNMAQQFLLPPNLEDMVPKQHVVRVVNEAIEKMDLSALISQYKGGGASSYHPKMMLKIVIYGYTQKQYSSRQIAKCVRENVHFMWLSGQNSPDFRTINRFRSSRMKDAIEHVFQSIIEMLVEGGYIALENYFLDGTIIEANANRYTYIWKKSTAYHKQNLQKRIKELLGHIDTVNASENDRYGDRDLDEVEGNVSSQRVDELVRELNEKLSKNSKPELKRYVRKLETNYLPRLKKYEAQENDLAGKNSCSKTDKDATFMRMKEDHLGTGQVKPAYNVQTGTENQFIVGYSIHQKSGDTSHMIEHLNKLEKQLGLLPKNLIADSGYGSEENYRFIANKSLGNFVKYSFFHREQQSLKKDRFRLERFKYDAKLDHFVCPAQKLLQFESTHRVKSENGALSSRRVYRCFDCATCDFKSDCLRSENGGRSVQVNLELEHLKNTAKQNLFSHLGKKLSTLRSVEVESVFGQIKHNMGFRKFSLRGLQNVTLEWGLIAIAHNLKKIPA